MKYKLHADEQGRLDAFNKRFGLKLENDEIVDAGGLGYRDGDNILSVRRAVAEFNNEVAQGEAIELIEVVE